MLVCIYVHAKITILNKAEIAKGPSINDVTSEGEGGGLPSKLIYYISLFSNLSQQGKGGGHKFGKMD